MNKEHLKLFVEQNPKLVKMTESTIYPGLFVLKYTRRVFYDNLWCDELEHCRGTIVDRDFNVISRPFTKIYNLGIEAKAPVLSEDTMVTAFRKVNGFMTAMTWYQGDILVSTTGSTDSEYVAMAKEMMLTHQSWADWQLAFNRTDMDGMTFMFECAHPNDPHIIPERSGLYLLGYRENTWNSKVGHDPFTLMELGHVFRCFVSESMTTNLARLHQLVKECRHEGYVAYTEEGEAFKIKSPHYLVNKWVTRNPRTDKLVDLNRDIKHQIDEEYYGLIDAIRLNIEAYTAMTEQERLAWVRNHMESGLNQKSN